MEQGTVGVVGYGAMGSGIAQVAAQSGHRVIVRDVSEHALAAGRERLSQFLAAGVQRGKVTAEQMAATLARITETTDWAALAPCSAVIEAVYEDLPVKQAAMRELSAVLDPAALVATNTSCLPVTEIAAAYARPERVCGLHFFNPAQLMKLVEVVRAVETSAATMADALALAGALGKEAVQTKDAPGFLVNRLLIPYLNQAIQAYDDGLTSREELDTAVELGLGYPMGPLRLADLIGLDVHLHASEALYADLRDRALSPPPLLRRMVGAGRLGRKTGRGFYDYGREG